MASCPRRPRQKRRKFGSPANCVQIWVVLRWRIVETRWTHSRGVLPVSRSLSFVPRSLRVQRVSSTTDQVVVDADPHCCSARCPTCGLISRRVHSCYVRKLRDLPSSGRPVLIRVSARRFRCVNARCRRLTFAERLDDASVGARRTNRLGQLQRYLGLALGGEAGARLALRISAPVSADTLLRMASSNKPDASSVHPPRVLAVDDWAWRRGHRYGSILVDLERNRVVDLLPDRQAGTLACWLREHPGVEIVARDRAGAYVDGIRQGAPDAVQVADRWHVLRNLGDAVNAIVERYQAGIRKLGKQMAGEAAGEPAAELLAIPRPTAAERRSQASYARRQARYAEAARLRALGWSMRRIAVVIGAERKTIRGWLRAGCAPQWRKPGRDSILDTFRGHLERRWSEGCRNAALLWRELLALGFSGRPSLIRQWAGRRRKAEPRAPAPAKETRPPTT